MKKTSIAVITLGMLGGLAVWTLRAPAADSALPVADLFRRDCSACHGITGDGNGPAARFLQPKPRSFRLGSFRLTSTANQRPTPRDLFRTISRGIPGTPMPPWGHLPEQQRWRLVDYVLDLNRQGWIEDAIEQGDTPEEARLDAEEGLRGVEEIEIPPEPPTNQAGLDRGRELFTQNCATCHGPDGRGKQDPSWRTAEGYPIRSRDFVKGVFKGGREGRRLFSRVAVGIAGTPMPSFGVSEDYWHIVHYVQSLSDPAAQRRAEMGPRPLEIHRLEPLPEDPRDERWESIPEQKIVLMPLDWESGAIHDLGVRVARDEGRIAFRLSWHGPRPDSHTAQTPVAAAVRLSGDPAPPLFVTETSGEPIALWRWASGAGAFPPGLLELLVGNESDVPPRPDTVEGTKGTLWTLQLSHGLQSLDSALGGGHDRGSAAFVIWLPGTGDSPRPSISVWNPIGAAPDRE